MKKLAVAILLVFAIALTFVLTACNQTKTVTVKFDLQGGQMSEPLVIKVEKDKTISLPTPTKDGCTFVGWFTGVQDESLQITEDTLIFDDITLYAHWLTPSQELEYTRLPDNTYACTGIGGFSGSTLVIPQQYEGVAVKSIADEAFADNSNLKSLVISDGVTSVGSYAFANCENLKSITVSSSVTSIGENAFSLCENVESVYISDLAAWCELDFGGYSANPLYYGGKLYLNSEEITNWTVPEDATKIGSFAFYNRTDLGWVNIPDSVRSIGESAFDGCKNMTSVVISENVETIGDKAFRGCSKLREISIPAQVETIGEWAFNMCSALEEITFEEGSFLKVIEKSTFSGCHSLKEFVFPSRVSTVNENAFYGCVSLTKVVVPETVTDIQSFVFSGCSNLTLYCAVDSRQVGWADNWVEYSIPVVWGYQQ